MNATDVTGRGRIVVGVDGSPSSKEALRWAARQAALAGAELTAVTTWEYPRTLGWAPPWPEDFHPEADAKLMLDGVIGEVLGRDTAARVFTAVMQGDAAAVMTDLSKSADLVVVGCRGHGEFAGMLLGSVSEFLVTHAHCPVVVVRTG